MGTLMKVNEIFYSVQGEGPLLGVPSVFVRMQGCNLKCSWCDSKYAWNGNDAPGFTHTELSDHLIVKYDHIKHFVFTGGEPLLQEDGLYSIVMDKLVDKHITFETNGTIAPHPDLYERVDLWMVSPKDDSYHEFDYIEKTHFKFVVDTTNDFLWIEEYINNWEIKPEQVWLMPQTDAGSDYRFDQTLNLMSKRLEWIIKWALPRGYNVTPRLQILVWGNKRGV